MNKLPKLKPGDAIDLIAPASRCADSLVDHIKATLTSWGFHCLIQEPLFGADLLCANSDAQRFDFLKNALLNEETQAIFCLRGGYGSMRLIPKLEELSRPQTPPKLFVGFSDITALHLFLNQRWQWPTLHAGLHETLGAESTQLLKKVFLGEQRQIVLKGVPLNTAARQKKRVEASILGGNLCLIQSSIGTSWQVNTTGQILLLEEIGERAYRIDRMLTQLQQSKLLKNAKAILLGDFLKGEEPNGSTLIQPVLERFAAECSVPVVQIKGIGHGPLNTAIPLGLRSQIYLDHDEVSLMIHLND